MGILDNLDLFSSLSEQERKSIEIFCQERTLSLGEILFNEGDDAVAMYIVKSGGLQAYTYSGILGNIEQDGFVGEMALFAEPQKRRMASVKSMSDKTTIIVMLYFSLIELEKKHPQIMDKIKNIVLKRNEENKNKGL
ncbi:MAG: cyclic nucleotide-binding domain-containing protein [Candidatus Gracilibacteria bacterium]|nr:cyclic nucleotide-binding domain-containing protein [Candidatus Gracilibacteria bacterium]